jgi:amino acid synthesis protein
VIRKLVTLVDEIVAEPGAGPAGPVRRAAAAAVIANPWAGQGRVADLQPAVEELAPAVAVALTDRLLEALGGAGVIEAFGKAALVGTDGEIEHGAALIHTPWFGDVVRQALDGTSIIVFSDARGPAGTSLVVPVWHKTAAATRSHYQTVEVRVPDAPRPDELVLVCAAATGGRPLARIGDRTTDSATVRLEDHRS